MKLRLDFVTNSSSSSYICECCGNIESGYDASMDELGFCECEHGHVICEHHVIKTSSFEDLRKALLKELHSSISYYGNKNEEYAIKNFVRLTDEIDFVNTITEEKYNSDEECETRFDDLVDYNELRDKIFEKDCPLCTHTLITNSEMIEYALKKFNMSRKEYEDIVREYLIEQDKNKKEK